MRLQKFSLKRFVTVNIFIKKYPCGLLSKSYIFTKVKFLHRYILCSFILCRLTILKNTYSNIFAERLQWLLLNITSILLIGGVFKFLKSYNRISLKTFSIQILFFKNLYHLKNLKNTFLENVSLGLFLACS